MFQIKFIYPNLASLANEPRANNQHKIGNYARFQNNIPAVNIEENADAYRLSLAAPGLKKSGFEIGLDNNLLTVCYHNEPENGPESQSAHKSLVRREFGYSNFKRVFSLPKTADTDKIEANYQDGILYISIAKKEESKPKPARQIALA